jgi:cysteine desulfurase
VQRFYFDHNATTPISHEVLEALMPVLAEDFGNASSIHQDGQRARHRLDEARRKTAALLGADPREIVFTSGGTEADNLAVFGIARGRHVVTTAIEHPAILNACAQLDTTFVKPDATGVVDPEDVRRALRADTALVSVMHVNNEIGTIQPISEIARVAQHAGIPFHSDGVQAAGRLPVGVKETGVDLYTISAHKMYAPKGAGALFVRKGTVVSPILYGGRHEQQRRAGTENVPGCYALGVACSAAARDLAGESERLNALRERLEAGVLRAVPDVRVVAREAPRAANTTNLLFDGIGGEAMVIALDIRGFAVSSGSACSSGAVEPSHVLLALGLSRDAARSSVRISLGRSNTLEQVDTLVDAIAESAAHLRRLSPAYAAHV